MHGIHRICVALILLAAAAPVLAGFKPAFSLGYSLQHATHIVLVTEGDVVDGNLEVIESWRGDLKPKAMINIPDLAQMADEKLNEVQWFREDLVHAPYVRKVTGQRIVLFLIDKDKAQNVHDSVKPAGDWLPASYYGLGGFKTSALWLENGEAYGFLQIFNPGPSELRHTYTEVEVKARIFGNNVIKDEYLKAVEQSDPIRLVQAMTAINTPGTMKACLHASNRSGRWVKLLYPPFGSY